MRSQNQKYTNHLPLGRVDIPGMLYGSVGVVLSFTLYWLGVFKRADSWLFDFLHKPLFHEGVPELLSMVIMATVAAVFCYGVAFSVLGSAGLWRKIVLGVTAIVLTLAMVPAFAVWNIYCSPVLQLVGVFWSWFCVVIYTQHHQMPCDPVHVDLQMAPPEPELLEPLVEPIAEPVIIEHSHDVMELPKTTESRYKPISEDGQMPR